MFVYACGSLPLIHALRAAFAEEGYDMPSSGARDDSDSDGSRSDKGEHENAPSEGQERPEEACDTPPEARGDDAGVRVCSGVEGVGVGEEENSSASSASSSGALLRHCWYADDSSALGNLHGILVWFRALRRIGASYGYHPEAAKCFLIVKPELEQIARELFEPEGMQIVTGKRFLGGYVGDEEGTAAFLCEKVEGWVHGVRALTSAARNFSHTAHAAMTRSLQMELDYVFRVVLTDESALSPLHEAIAKKLLPALLGGPVTPSEVDLMLLPARFGGTGIRDHLDRAAAAYPASRAGTKVVSKSIQGKAPFHPGDHRATIRHALTQSRQQQDIDHKAKREAALPHIDRQPHRVLSRSAEYKTSGWLTTLCEKRPVRTFPVLS
ncbi:unnamed protein product [Vitrella brassicaformis CCMP3155]|uniref:Uncharacterized protein n=1 Tax=Vitrella brassicaformis (strain CCMP3155) TaxID=1169540 RepID=A0A0G4H316_VITBC|nr:unnamed protein product [Vitrella brassicaformis CCMP3155]|eukprot:CEM38072.1 unnamed protein product [Vitrella brassicaformis CCMP3155]